MTQSTNPLVSFNRAGTQARGNRMGMPYAERIRPLDASEFESLYDEAPEYHDTVDRIPTLLPAMHGPCRVLVQDGKPVNFLIRSCRAK